MLSILLISSNGEGYEVAEKFSQDCITKLWIENPKSQFISQGSQKVRQVQNYQEHLQAADMVLCLNSKRGGRDTLLSKKRGLVVGDNSVAKMMDRDNGYVKNLVRLMDVDTFSLDKGLIPSFTLEGWFNGEQWVTPFNISFNYCRLMDGDKGVLTPSMGEAMFTFQQGKIIESTLLPLTKLFRETRYIGPFSLILTLDKEKLFLIDLNPHIRRFSLSLLSECTKGPLEIVLFNLLNSNLSHWPMSSSGISVKLSVSPYPYLMDKVPSSFSYLNYPKEAEKHIYLYSPGGNLKGELGWIAAHGSSIREARRRVYRTINKAILSPEVQYRTDISTGIETLKNNLTSWRWIDAPKERKVEEGSKLQHRRVVTELQEKRNDRKDTPKESCQSETDSSSDSLFKEKEFEIVKEA